VTKENFFINKFSKQEALKKEKEAIAEAI